MDQLFLIVISMLLFFTQPEFAFLEYEIMVLKNKRNILKRSNMDYAAARVF